jgi:hypothetical protein
MLNRLKQLISPRSKPEKKQDLPDIAWVPPGNNQWKIPVLDVRPVTQTMLSTTRNQECAKNSMSYGRDDGTGFANDTPGIQRTIPVDLAYRIDRVLVPGALFIPAAMEHKWAIYYHGARILFVRSWMRKVVAAAQVECNNGVARLVSVMGTFAGDDEAEEFTIRTTDYLLRTHALGLMFPAPLPPGFELEPKTAAVWCMNVFGKMASYATPQRLAAEIPDKPLRTYSLLHIAVAQGDAQAVGLHLQSGFPVDLLAGDGLAPLHWAFAQKSTAMADFLIQHGSPVDVRSAEGATPLMTEVQAGKIENTKFLLDRGADANAVDLRGFSSLHRAAELGHVELTLLLLKRGAHPDVMARGQTPMSLAEKRGHGEIVKLLSRKSEAS